MFIACRRRPTPAIARSVTTTVSLALYLGFALIIGCSKQQPAPQEDWSLGADDVVKAELTAGGVATRYQARFDGAELQRIVETRTIDAREDSGDYTFKGARLIEYQGATLNGRTQARLTFNLQGALTDGRADLTQEEISEITNRAQLLRSLVLARKASRGHGG